MKRNERQELIDVLFEVAIRTKESETLQAMDREEYGEWVRRQLRQCGWDTEPMGCSWAVLK